jgi:uncharacterized protein (DUF1697 family)
MPIYIAMLRGINVGGHNRIIKMELLRESLTALGLKRVGTYIQSGNIVFDSGKMNAASLAETIEQTILKDFGISPLAIVRSAKDMAAIIAGNPLLCDSRVDLTKLHVYFLAEPPADATAKELKSLASKPDTSHLAGGEIYLYLPNGVSSSSVWNSPVERRLLKRATMRNWKTVNALHEMAKAMG